jgi:glucan 1,3-beta-glucosidase
VHLQGTQSGINIYNLNTIGSTQMITINGVQDALWSDNIDVFPDTIGLFRYSS